MLAFKEKIVNGWEDSKYLCKQKERLVKNTSQAGQKGQAPFQLDDMPEGCKEFNYPNDDQHWAQVTRVCYDEEFSYCWSNFRQDCPRLF